MQAKYIKEGLACSGMPITTSISNRESNMAAAAITIFIFCIMGVATSVELKEEGEAFLMVYIKSESMW